MSQKHFAKVLAQHPSQIITVWTGGDPTPRGGGKSLPSTFLEAAACHSFSVNSGVNAAYKAGMAGRTLVTRRGCMGIALAPAWAFSPPPPINSLYKGAGITGKPSAGGPLPLSRQKPHSS